MRKATIEVALGWVFSLSGDERRQADILIRALMAAGKDTATAICIAFELLATQTVVNNYDSSYEIPPEE